MDSIDDSPIGEKASRIVCDLVSGLVDDACAGFKPGAVRACTTFGRLARSELGLLLSAACDQGGEGGASVSNVKPTRRGDIDVYPQPAPVTKSFEKEEVIARWVYQEECGSFSVIPLKSTAWMTEWLLSDGVLPTVAPSFAPVADYETRTLSVGRRIRRSQKLEQVRSLCTGVFKVEGDFYKSQVQLEE